MARQRENAMCSYDEQTIELTIYKLKSLGVSMYHNNISILLSHSHFSVTQFTQSAYDISFLEG